MRMTWDDTVVQPTFKNTETSFLVYVPLKLMERFFDWNLSCKKNTDIYCACPPFDFQTICIPYNVANKKYMVVTFRNVEFKKHA